MFAVLTAAAIAPCRSFWNNKVQCQILGRPTKRAGGMITAGHVAD